MTSPSDADHRIADAARRYVAAAAEDRARHREGTRLEAAQALARLAWLIKAEQYGWDEVHYQEHP